MAWLRVDDRVRTHPKIVEAGPAASWLWFCGICYCREHLTDGFLSAGILASLAPGVNSSQSKRCAERLVAARLWHVAEGGYWVHDFLDWNPTRADVLAKRLADLERKKPAYSERKDSGVHSDSTATRDAHAGTPAGLGSGLGYGLEPGSEEGPGETTPAGGRRADFERFWSAYPRKVGKDAAWKAWQYRKPDAALVATIIAAVTAQAQSVQWQRDGGQFIPHPRTWLSQGRWQDEDVPGSVITHPRAVPPPKALPLSPDAYDRTQSYHDEFRAIREASAQRQAEKAARGAS